MNAKIIGNLILALLSTLSLSSLSFMALSLSDHDREKSLSINQKETLSSTEKKALSQFAKYPKILVFSADQANKGKGKLIAINTKKASIDGAWDAVSGIGGKEDQPARGPTPSNKQVNFHHYTLTVKPLYLNQPGIYGNFYQYLPFSFKVNGKERGNFGIHADRTAPGTLGCIGVTDGPQWEAFKQLMSEYEAAGLQKIPLLVANR